MDIEPAAVRFIEAAANTHARRAHVWRAGDANTIRAHQILRGQVAAERASKALLASLESVETSDLSDEDKCKKRHPPSLTVLVGFASLLTRASLCHLLQRVRRPKCRRHQ